jgi:thiamine biosynthesis protein ThiS
MASIEISCNGESRQTKSETLEQLIVELSLADKKVALELNKVIIPREKYSLTKLSAGDVIEIVHFVGGG